MVSALDCRKAPMVISSFDGEELIELWDAEFRAASSDEADTSTYVQNINGSSDIPLNETTSEHSYYSYEYHSDKSFISCVTHQSLAEISDKNNNYRKWIKQLSSELKNKEVMEQIRQEERLKRRQTLRDQLVKRARKRKPVNFYSTTHLSESNLIRNNQNIDATIFSAETRGKQKEAEINRIKAIRIKSKVKYRQFLETCKKKLKAEAEAKKEEENKQEDLRRKVKAKVLRSLQQHKVIRDGNMIMNAMQGNGINAVRGHRYIEDDCKLERKTNIRHLTEKCKAELKEIRRKKVEKQLLLQQKSDRLQRRAQILKNKRKKAEFINEEKISKTNETPDKTPGLTIPIIEKSANRKIVLTEVEVEGMVQRLGRHKPFNDNVIRGDFETWKLRKGLNVQDKVFFLTGWYPAIRENLLERGWVFNEDKESLCYDLAWTLHSRELRCDNIPRTMKTNHFRNNTCLTTKTGLLHSLRNNASFFADADFLEFFPRGYDLSITSDMQDFIDDFRITMIESELQCLLSTTDNFNSNNEHRTHDRNLYINPGILEILLNIISRRYRTLCDDDLKNSFQDKSLFSETESEITLKCKQWLYKPVFSFGNDDDFFDCDRIPNAIDNFLFSEEYAEPNDKQKRRKLLERKRISEKIDSTRPIRRDELLHIQTTLKRGETNHHFRRQAINGSKGLNLWIVKPAEKSRGRGIATFSCIEKLLKYVEAAEKKQSRWFVQKYIENALLIANRRFDIRQWVLVTCLDPLTIWCHSDFYTRFASEPYCLMEDNGYFEKEEWLRNNFRHLVNNSVNKDNNLKFNTEFIAENGACINEHMWSKAEFIKWLVAKTNDETIWTDKVFPKMQDIIKQSLMCAQGTMVPRENSWELFGYDFMIDDNYTPWLIEINSSPSCEYSTSVTSSFVPNALRGILSIVLDNREGEQQVDDWVKIYQGNNTSNPMNSLGVELNIHCKKIPVKIQKKLSRTKLATVKNPIESKRKSSSIPQMISNEEKMKKGRPQLNISSHDLIFDDSDLSECKSNGSEYEGKENITKNHSIQKNNFVKVRERRNQLHAFVRKEREFRKVLVPMTIKTVEWS